MTIYANSKKTIPAESFDKVCDIIVSKVALNDNECWIWGGSIGKNGYGKMRINGVDFYTHRVSAELFHPTFNPDLLVCHECPNGHDKACMNPWHLVQGTQKYNMNNEATRQLISDRTKEAMARKRA